MRLAVLSDIHGNVRALDAVLTDIAGREITDIVNLRDCAYGPFDPKPVMNRLLELGLTTVSGNEDRILVEAASGTPHSQAAVSCAKILDRLHIEWLANLPPALSIHGAFLFHGIPEDDCQYLLMAVDESGVHMRDQLDIKRLLTKHSHPLAFCGHDHSPRVIKLGDRRMIVNPGSVGCPAYADEAPHEHVIENGSPHARYAIVEIRNTTTIAELVEISYDWNNAAQEAEANGFLNWAYWIATGLAG